MSSDESFPREAESRTDTAAAPNREWLLPEEWSDREKRLTEAFARVMHALTSGDWAAAGFETQQRFRLAAAYAVVALNNEGLDLLDILPKGAQGRA